MNMPATLPTKDDIEDALAEDMQRFQHDPLGWVLYSFDWGEGELERYPNGPDQWQRERLSEIGEALRNGEANHFDAVQMAVASGHGIGKSALVSWLILWAISTFVDTKGVVTANTETQLRTKTWAELAKWFRLCIVRHWFKLTATAIFSVDPDHEKTWRIDQVPWSAHNTEAFAGLHNQGKRILIVFDEASTIDDLIWEVTEGALTDADTEIMWVCFGNPTRNTGRFRECFRRYKHRWIHKQIDSRKTAMSNKNQIAKWVQDYGEDSDFVRVRVRGIFPRASDLQLIPSDWTAAAMKREPTYTFSDALVCGIDIARGGADNNVVRFRRGLDARTIPKIKIPGSETRDTTKFIAKVCTVVVEQKPDAVFVDSTGVGGPIADQLRRLLPGVPIIDVNFASAAPDGHYANMRTYIWWKMRDAIKSGLAIENSSEFDEELTSPEYSHNARDQIQLEKKDDIKKRLGVSPDDADALALTFTMPVMKLRDATMRTDWDPYAEAGDSGVQTNWNPYG